MLINQCLKIETELRLQDFFFGESLMSGNTNNIVAPSINKRTTHTAFKQTHIHLQLYLLANHTISLTDSSLPQYPERYKAECDVHKSPTLSLTGIMKPTNSQRPHTESPIT